MDGAPFVAAASPLRRPEQGDAVGLLDAGDDPRHGAVGVDAVNALRVDLARLVAEVARVREVDPPLGVDGQVVGAVEALALPAAGEDDDLAVPLGARDAAV